MIARAEVHRRARIASASLRQGDVRLAMTLIRQIVDDLEPRRRVTPVDPATEKEQKQLEIALPIHPASLVPDCPLHCGISHAGCIDRQLENEKLVGRANGNTRRGCGGRSTTAKKRGITPEYPTCLPSRCPVGERVRAAITQAQRVRPKAKGGKA